MISVLKVREFQPRLLTFENFLAESEHSSKMDTVRMRKREHKGTLEGKQTRRSQKDHHRVRTRETA